MCCLIKIAHYANEPRQESVARQVPLWETEAPLALASDSGRMTLVLYQRRALTRSLERNRGLGRAFDKAVRRKPLARDGRGDYEN
jgi:hypothetical protein